MHRFSAFWHMRLPHRLQGQKSKSRGGGILWRPPSRTACQDVCTKRFELHLPTAVRSNKNSYILYDLKAKWSWRNVCVASPDGSTSIGQYDSSLYTSICCWHALSVFGQFLISAALIWSNYYFSQGQGYSWVRIRVIVMVNIKVKMPLVAISPLKLHVPNFCPLPPPNHGVFHPPSNTVWHWPKQWAEILETGDIRPWRLPLIGQSESESERLVQVFKFCSGVISRGGGMYPGKYLTESAEANHCTRRQLDPSSNFITVHPRDQPTNDQRHQLNRAPQVSTFYAYQ